MPISTIGSNSLNQTSDLTINGQTVGKGGGNVATNTAHGVSALAANTTGLNNTVVGSQAGDAGNFSYNTIIGSRAGGVQTSGDQNTYVGEESGGAITTGSKNTIIGRYNGNQSFLDMRTLSNYVVLSDGDGNAKQIIDNNGKILFGTTGAGNNFHNRLNIWDATSAQTGIYMQKYAQVEVQIGFKAGTNTDFFIGTGSTTVGTYGVYLANTGNSWISVSDLRQKNIIEPIGNALTKVSAIRAVIGKYKHDADGVRRSFLIAQDVQAVFPEAVKTQEDEEALLGLSYTDVIPLLVAAIKELKAEVDALKTRLTP
jgi:hypothetical protein